MYLPIPPQPDCVAGWREAVRLVDLATGHQAQNVVISVAEPTARATLACTGATARRNSSTGFATTCCRRSGGRALGRAIISNG